MSNAGVTHEEERLLVRMIEGKIREGGYASLTEQEKNIYAYSPYGTGGGCPSHSAVHAQGVDEMFEVNMN